VIGAPNAPNLVSHPSYFTPAVWKRLAVQRANPPYFRLPLELTLTISSTKPSQVRLKHLDWVKKIGADEEER